MKTLLLFLCLATSVSAQDLSLKRGVVMDSLPVNDSLSDTFSLYLPTGFSLEKKMPAIFIFDGEGRGVPAARMFVQPAEEQGYILISSNKVASGKGLKENLTSALILIQEVIHKIPIDLSYVSAAGFADGATVASSLPLVFDDLFGVIYIGDHNFNYAHMKKDMSFLAIGIVGNKQEERHDMWGASQHLNYLREANQLYVFEGEKEWPNPGIVESAVGALTLQAMRTEKRPRELQLIIQLYNEDLAFVEDLIGREEYILAGEFLEELEDKYENLIDTEEAENRLRQLKKSNPYKDQKDKIEVLRKKYDISMFDLIYYLDQDISTGNFANLGWWNYRKTELEKVKTNAEPMETSMAANLLLKMKEMSEEAKRNIEGDSYSLESKLMANMIATIFNQQNFDAYKDIISLSAEDGDFSTALYYLEELLKNGYADGEALYDIEGILGLKTSKEFNWLVKKYLGSSKYYKNATSLY